MQNNTIELYTEVLNYANKRYNAGLTKDCLIFVTKNEDEDEIAFVGLNKKQADAVTKSIKTVMRLNNFKGTQDDNAVYSNALEQAIDVKVAQQELQNMNITLQ